VEVVEVDTTVEVVVEMTVVVLDQMAEEVEELVLHLCH
jgi:hypothetical protein